MLVISYLIVLICSEIRNGQTGLKPDYEEAPTTIADTVL